MQGVSLHCRYRLSYYLLLASGQHESLGGLLLGCVAGQKEVQNHVHSDLCDVLLDSGFVAFGVIGEWIPCDLSLGLSRLSSLVSSRFSFLIKRPRLGSHNKSGVVSSAMA